MTGTARISTGDTNITLKADDNLVEALDHSMTSSLRNGAGFVFTTDFVDVPEGQLLHLWIHQGTHLSFTYEPGTDYEKTAELAKKMVGLIQEDGRVSLTGDVRFSTPEESP